jgi:hypothetical protein
MTDMTPSVFIAADALDTLQRYRLDSFEALWSVQAEPVDEPNNSRGGHSSVSRLTLKDANDNPQVFYLKRQSNYLIRTVRRPLGEPTAARELYNIERYARLGIPALQAAFFSQRQIKGKWQAVLLTQDLEGYLPLNHWLTQWHILSYCQKRDLLEAAAKLVALLHARSIVHNCLYPKHIFLKPTEDGTGARLIDLEKSRAHLFSPRGRMRDLETLHRRSQPPSRSQRLRFLLSYLGKSKVDAQVRYWVTRLLRRSALKSAKHDKCTVQKFCG